MKVNEALSALGISSGQFCRLMGVTRQYLHHYRSNDIPLPAYIQAHIQTVLILPMDVRATVFRERVGP